MACLVRYCAHVRCSRMCKAHRAVAERDLFATCQNLVSVDLNYLFLYVLDVATCRCLTYKSTEETSVITDSSSNHDFLHVRRYSFMQKQLIRIEWVINEIRLDITLFVLLSFCQLEKFSYILL